MGKQSNSNGYGYAIAVAPRIVNVLQLFMQGKLLSGARALTGLQRKLVT